MLDLTDKNVDELIQKYNTILELITPHNQIPYIAYITDVSVNYIKENYGKLDIDWKCWSVMVVQKLFFYNKIKKESDIKKYIDDFVEFQKNEYQNYCDNIAICSSDFDRDNEFMYSFIIINNK